MHVNGQKNRSIVTQCPWRDGKGGAQFQNPGPHQRPLHVAATGCAKYVRDNLHVNETIRKITIHK